MRRAAGGWRVIGVRVGFSLGPSTRLAALLEAVWLLAERAGRRSGGLGNGEHLEELPALLVAQPLRLKHFSNRCHRVYSLCQLVRSSGSIRITCSALGAFPTSSAIPLTSPPRGPWLEPIAVSA
jgi:hypothetical protein